MRDTGVLDSYQDGWSKQEIQVSSKVLQCTEKNRELVSRSPFLELLLLYTSTHLYKYVLSSFVEEE